MGFGFRKSIKLGPARINLSKSGVGFSAGVKGARIGVNARGRSYGSVSAGGFSYRTSGSMVANGAGSAGSVQQVTGSGCLSVFLWVVGGVVFLYAFGAVSIAAGSIVVPLIFLAVPGAAFAIYIIMKELQLSKYKGMVTDLIRGGAIPEQLVSDRIMVLREKISLRKGDRNGIRDFNDGEYRTAIKGIMADGFVSEEERGWLKHLELILGIGTETIREAKCEVFSEVFREAIEDSKISREEHQRLQNVLTGLHIEEEWVADELKILNQLIQVQRITWPLPIVDTNVPVQKSETVYYSCAATVLYKRKAKYEPSGFEYVSKRKGTLVITNKRVAVIGDGTSALALSEIESTTVVPARSVVEFTKKASGVPLVVETTDPILLAHYYCTVKNGVA